MTEKSMQKLSSKTIAAIDFAYNQWLTEVDSWTGEGNIPVFMTPELNYRFQVLRGCGERGEKMADDRDWMMSL